MSKVEETTNEKEVNAIDAPITNLDEFDLKHGICDITTPRETYLCGRYKRSFAYYTIRHRLPNILRTLLNSLKENLNGNNCSKEDLTSVLESIENLKNQLENNGRLEKFTANEADKDVWNDFIASLPLDASFFHVCWLYAECYLYRKIYSFFEILPTLHDYDYFGPQKTNALKISHDAMEELIRSCKGAENNCETFCHILKLNLWGNKCDLSLSSGQEVKPLDNLNKLVDSLNANILIDDSAQIWKCLRGLTTTCNKTVDLICDNAGFELFTDLLLGLYLIENKLTDIVRFHVKAMPWFVSDTTSNDIRYTLMYMEEHKSSENLKNFGKQCSDYFKEGQFQLVPEENFWTTPYEFYRMQEICPSLYKQLSTSSLIIFKGDLNYRKLLGDFNWDFTENFQKCRRGFQPTNLCTLRTVKGDLICGLKEGLAENLTLQNNDWMFTGEYAVIQYTNHADG